MKKRILPFLLAVILCLSLPVTALAAVDTTYLEGAMSQRWTGTKTETINGKAETVYLFPAGTQIDRSYTYKDGAFQLFLQEARNLDTGENVYSYMTYYDWTQTAPKLTLDSGLYYFSFIELNQTAGAWWPYYVRIGEGNTTPTEPTEQPSSWAAEQVQQAVDAGIVPESLQSKYTQATTRAEFCALAVDLYETVKGAEITERKTFTDTTDVNVEKLAAIGVVSGMTETEFWPDSELTREQAAAMLARLANAIGKPLAASAPTFADNDAISSWAVDSVGQVQAAGIMSGMGENQFAPAGDYTREQSISTMLRLYNVVK